MTRRQLELEKRQLERARADYMRWYGPLDRDEFDRLGARLAEVREQLATMPPREGKAA